MEKRLLNFQPDVKQASRVPAGNETRPPLNRSKTYNDKKFDNGNKPNRYNRAYDSYRSRNNNKGINSTENETVQATGEGVDATTPTTVDSRKKNRRSNEKAELNNEDLDSNSMAVVQKQLKQRGGNLNHLLNFKFLRQEPYQVYERDFHSNASKASNTSRPMVFTKEMFLQANCQFLVNNDGDYASHFKNPDSLVDWCKIEEVILRSHQQISCPICLYPPIAAKITKCGHIYCWSCILNYLALSENKWRKCPICFESIYKDDLKSVRILKNTEYKVGDMIELNLMFKEKSSTLIYPLNLFKFYESNKPAGLNDFTTVDDYDCCKKYLKIQTVHSSYINEDIIKRESDELHKQLQTEVCEDSVKLYINEALGLLEKKKVLMTNEAVVVKKAPVVEVKKSPVVEKIKDASVRYEDAFDLIEKEVEEEVVEEEKEEEEEEIEAEKLEREVEETTVSTATATTAAATTTTNSSYSHFYQAEDGQRIYMNSLNLRCLLHEYSKIEKCPLKIEAKIVAIENMFMNYELRRRYKYLSHIPLHSEFQIVELELKEPVVSAKTLGLFEEQIKSKELARKEKEEREKKLERKNYLRMNTFPGAHGGYDPNVELYQDYQENIQDYNQEFPNIAATATSASIPIQQQQQQLQQKQDSASSSSEQSASTTPHLNFAQKLKKKVDDWPSLAAPTENKAFAMNFSQRLTETSTKQQTPAATVNAKTGLTKPPTTDTNTDDFESESLPAPTYQRSFMFAIDAAFQNLELNSTDNADGKSKQKNKKQKKTKNLLFST